MLCPALEGKLSICYQWQDRQGGTRLSKPYGISSRYFRNHPEKLHLPMTVIDGHGMGGT